MGNRAVITTKEKKVSLYLHWNGGRDSVEAFLEYCRLQGFRAPSHDTYGWARLTQVIANYFGGNGLSVGIDRYTNDEHEDPGDNGIYVIEGWQIVERIGLYDGFIEQREYPLQDMLLEIDAEQPASMQLGKDFITAIDTNTLRISAGDKVFMRTYSGLECVECVGHAGENTLYPGLPIVSLYTDDAGKPDLSNPNNYLRDDSYRVLRKERK